MTQYMVHAGKLDPDLTAGLNMNFRYKNWTLATSFYWSTGNQCFLSSPYGEMNNTYGMPSEYKNASTQLLKRWRKSGDEKYTNIPSIPVGENCLPMYPFKDSSVSLLSLRGVGEFGCPGCGCVVFALQQYKPFLRVPGEVDSPVCPERGFYHDVIQSIPDRE